MACRLDGVKPLSEPMLDYCQLDPSEQTSMKFQSKFKHFHSRKCTSNCRLRNGVHFVSAPMCTSISSATKIAIALSQMLFLWHGFFFCYHTPKAQVYFRRGHIYVYICFIGYDITAPLGLCSLSWRTSYRKISWSLEATRLNASMFVSIWNVTGTSAARLARCLSNVRSIGKFKIWILRLRSFTRSCSKVSVRLLNRGPAVGWSAA